MVKKFKRNEPCYCGNNNKVYKNNTIWETNNFGKIKIIGGSDRVDKNGKNKYVFVEFVSDNTVIETRTSSIRTGEVKNPNQPSVFGVGYLGQGINRSSYQGKRNKKYILWHSMMTRCYNKKIHEAHPTYKNCTVDESWHNFQNFCKDLPKLEGYELWLNSNNDMQLDKDIIKNGNKIYSKDRCKFVTRNENMKKENRIYQKNNIKYIGIRISDGYTEEFLSQKDFSIKYNLKSYLVCRCLKGNRKTHAGWKFKILSKQI